MIKSIFPVALMLCTANAYSQLARLNSPYTAVGTYSKNFNDVFSIGANQASLAQIKGPVAGVYSERRFLLKELSGYSVIMAAPLSGGGAAMNLNFTGGEDYNQSGMGLAYGRTLGEKAALGIQFNYNRLHLKGYGNAGGINFELGSILHLTEKLYAGCHVYNPLRKGFAKPSDEKLPSLYSFGFGYEANSRLLISTIVQKEEDLPVTVRASLQYAPVKQFFLRAGVSTTEGFSFIGVAISWKNFRTDLSSSWHPQLGFTPAISMVFGLKKEEPVPQ